MKRNNGTVFIRYTAYSLCFNPRQNGDIMSLLDFLPPLIVACGTVLLFKLSFFFILHPKRSFKTLKKGFGNRKALKALMLSLAGTLGVGNIVGVAFGISVGGAGSVFWLLVSSIFSMIIKYSEVLISSELGEKDGMIGVVSKSHNTLSKPLSVIYALLCILLSLTMGSALQARAAVEALSPKSPATLTVIAILFTVLVGYAIIGGGKKIENVTSFLIPFASICYIFLCLSVIAVNREALPRVIKSVFSSAFNFGAVGGGIGGFMINSALREGFCRGLLSNEAGAGTSTLAHARNTETSAHTAGMLGITEVFVDTVVLCTLTALTVLCALPVIPEAGGVDIIRSAVGTIGSFARPLLAFCILCFAYSTVICWYYYGKVAIKFISKKQHGWYIPLFLFTVFTGSLTSSGTMIILSDYLLFVLSLISLFTLIKNLDRISHLSRKYIKEDGCGKED